MSSPVVLITGALTGIGRATAVAFAKEGASIVASGRREAEGKALEAELRSLGAEAAFIRADVRHDDEVRNLVDQTVARFGRIDAPSTPQAPRARLARSWIRPPKATRPPLTPTRSARCSA
jgi:NAD(P)-dependent dehydrogenase (short-subunit alcohol dehydrogenase family)